MGTVRKVENISEGFFKVVENYEPNSENYSHK
jgi:hypothetical protein